jgi:ribonuclease HI
VILAYADASVDHPLYSTGYVLYETDGPTEQLLDTGVRTWHAGRDDRSVSWTTHKAEYMAGIYATRAALDHSHEPLILSLDNADVVEHIKNRTDKWEEYFPHALYSFLPRFQDYTVRMVHRDNNEAAHRQANMGLQAIRDLESGVF